MDDDATARAGAAYLGWLGRVASWYAAIFVGTGVAAVAVCAVAFDARDALLVGGGVALGAAGVALGPSVGRWGRRAHAAAVAGSWEPPEDVEG